MDAAGEHPDRVTAGDAVPVRRAPWGTRGRLAVAAAALGVAVAVAAVALRSVGVDLGGPVSVAAGATAQGGDDLHRIEPVAVAQSPTTAGPATTDAGLTGPASPAGSDGSATPTPDPGGATAAAIGAAGAVPTTPGTAGIPTTLPGGVLPGVTVPPPSDVTSPIISALPPPLDTTVSTLLQPVDPLLQPLDPILGGLLGSGTTTTTRPR